MTLDGRPLADCVGREWLSPWRDVTAEAVVTFAGITGDAQWIHVDSERARRESPYGGTIAHGFFTLALASRLLREAAGGVQGARMSINYGLDRVRFPAPLPTGSRVRGRCTLQALEAVDGGVQAAWHILIEGEGSAKPCCAAVWLVRYYTNDV